MTRDQWNKKRIKLRSKITQELTLKQMKETYDALYYLADLMLKKHKPCRIKQTKEPNGYKRTKFSVVCKNDQSTCCDSCKYRGIDGCLVRCLGCKLFLCNMFVDYEWRCHTDKGEYNKPMYIYSVIFNGISALKTIALMIHWHFAAYYLSKTTVFYKIQELGDYKKRGKQWKKLK